MANGQLPDSALVVVEDDDRLIHTAAAAFLNFKAYAASQGRTLRIAEPAGSYRPLGVQVDMLEHPERYGLNTDSKAGLAKPGFSGHGDGNCADLVGTDLNWIIVNAGRFGFSRPFGANDPNHFKHDGRTAITMPAGAGAISPITSRKQTDDDMDLFFINDGAGVLMTADGIIGLPSPQVYNLFWRVKNSDQGKNFFNNTGKPEEFNVVERNLMDAILRTNARLNAAQATSTAPVALDPVKWAAAISDELAKKGLPPISARIPEDQMVQLMAGEQVTTGVTNEELAEALAASIPRVTKAILKAQGDALSAAAK